MTWPASRGWLAGVALALGALAPLAGSPFLAQHGHIDVDELASTVAHEGDHVDAVDLAQWIKDRAPGLRVVDVRSATEFNEFHVPTAENIPLEQVPHTPFAAADTIVLYSGGGAHAAQAWVFLRALGYRRVYFLSGGLDEWLTDVMSPALAIDATPDERKAFLRAAPLSRYFGGVPVVDVPRSQANVRGADAHTSDAPHTGGRTTVQDVRRRGC